MKNTFIFVLLFSLIFPLTSWGDSVESEAIKFLPKILQSIAKKNVSKKVVLDLLGKPALIENGVHYWGWDGVRYPIALGFDGKNSTLTHLTFVFMSNKPNINDFKNLPRLGEFEAINRDHPREYLWRGKKVELIINPASQTIETIRLEL